MKENGKYIIESIDKPNGNTPPLAQKTTLGYILARREDED